jgi:hypothetical protein
MDYYNRKTNSHIDGSPIFKTEEDERSEQGVAKILEKYWSVQIKSFGKLSVIDWYAIRQERLVGLIELKTRYHDVSKFPTVFLNVRKWLALLMGSNGIGVPSIFCVRWQNCIKYINIGDIDATRVKIGGCKKIVKSRNDIEPVIEVPISEMTNVQIESV